jgi:hypothetical protein
LSEAKELHLSEAKDLHLCEAKGLHLREAKELHSLCSVSRHNTGEVEIGEVKRFALLSANARFKGFNNKSFIQRTLAG